MLQAESELTCSFQEDPRAGESVPDHLQPSGRRTCRGRLGRLSSCLVGATAVFASTGAATCWKARGGRAASVASMRVQPLVLAASADEQLRKAQGLCLELPGVQLAGVKGHSLGDVPVTSGDDCSQHCRELVDCAQATWDAGEGCRVFSGTTSIVAKLGREYHSAYCGLLTHMGDFKPMQQKLVHEIQARKTQGICVELPGLQLAEGEGSTATNREDGAGSTADCFELCRTLPNCKQATFSSGSRTCSFFETASSMPVIVGKDFSSAYCGELRETPHIKELQRHAERRVRLRKAQGICVDLEGVLLAGGHRVPAELSTAAECSETCRLAPGCSQAAFSKGSRSCYHSANATKQVALLGGVYFSSYCGQVEMTRNMMDMKQAVQSAVKARSREGTCVEVEAVALGVHAHGGLAQLSDLPSAAECFERCRAVPGCRRATFTRGSGTCRFFAEVSADVAHVGGAYASAYCGAPEGEERRRAMREQVQKAVQMRRAMGVCEEVPGIQLADGRGGASLAAFAPGTNATPAACVEECRREPGCAQAIFSSGNAGCYLFKEAAPLALHANNIYLSAYCGEVQEAGRIAKAKRKVLQQVQMRRATGICKEIKGIQIADGSGYHEAIFSNETGTPQTCIEACRKRLGCEQVVFSEGNQGCYVFETASTVKALHEGRIFHSAYCGDLENAKIMEARRQEIERQVKDRKAHGLCFETPGIRARDGISGTLAKFSGNATRKRCVERCRTMLSCEQAVFSVKDSECHIYEKAADDVFHEMLESQTYHSAFCGAEANWKVHKAQQVKVMKIVDGRKKSGACIDLPGVQLYAPKGVKLQIWAGNASQCVEHCRARIFCGQVAYENSRCLLFQNYTVAFSALGKTYHSARCSDWSSFSKLQAMQNMTLALMKARA